MVFKPKRLVYRVPLVSRYEQLSYESADPIVAAASVMLLMIPVVIAAAIYGQSRRWRAVAVSVALLVLTVLRGQLSG